MNAAAARRPGEARAVVPAVLDRLAGRADVRDAHARPSALKDATPDAAPTGSVP